jgi:hypothetical protein
VNVAGSPGSALEVWLPLRRFFSALPRRACFIPAALLGFALRSVPLSQGNRAVSAAMNPLAVSPAVATDIRRCRAGPAGRGLWALTLARVPCWTGSV